jgi:polyhydroxybutyrate depolymerase
MRYALLVTALAACGGGNGETPTQIEFGGDRVAYLEVPTTYDHSVPTPLLVVLHGFTANGYTQLRYTHLIDLVEGEGILAIGPDGTVNDSGQQFWNATDACCDEDDSGVDDVAYLGGLVEEIQSVYNVDPAQVFFFGHSNGGYMSYRMACDRTDLVSALVSLAGATWADSTACTPSETVSVLQIHGDLDSTVLYAGGDFSIGSYPGAVETVRMWADYDGCGELATTDERLDLDEGLSGDDTAVARHGGCPEGIDAELWTIEGGGHIPDVSAGFPDEVWAWLSAHARP